MIKLNKLSRNINVKTLPNIEATSTTDEFSTNPIAASILSSKKNYITLNVSFKKFLFVNIFIN